MTYEGTYEIINFIDEFVTEFDGVNRVKKKKNS